MPPSSPERAVGPTCDALQRRTNFGVQLCNLHSGRPVRRVQGRRQPLPVAVQKLGLVLPSGAGAGCRTGLRGPGAPTEQQEGEDRRDGPARRHFNSPTDGYVANALGEARDSCGEKHRRIVAVIYFVISQPITSSGMVSPHGRAALPALREASPQRFPPSARNSFRSNLDSLQSC